MVTMTICPLKCCILALIGVYAAYAESEPELVRMFRIRPMQEPELLGGPDRYIGVDGKVVVDVLGNRKIRVKFFGEKSELEAKDSWSSRVYFKDGVPKFVFDADERSPWLSEAAPVNGHGVGIGVRIPLLRETRSGEKSPNDAMASGRACPQRHPGQCAVPRQEVRRHASRRYLVRSVRINEPYSSTPLGMRCGYDIAVGDWVKPCGRGRTADLCMTIAEDASRIVVEAGKTTMGFHQTGYIKKRGLSIPGFGREKMSGRPVVIDSDNSQCWVTLPEEWADGIEPQPDGSMMCFTARGVPAALNFSLGCWNTKRFGKRWACTIRICVNTEINLASGPPDCDADLVETAEGTAVYYGGWEHPPVSGRGVTDTNAIRRLIVDGIADEIPGGAFKGLKNLRQVVFLGPTRVGQRAFANCPQLHLIHDMSTSGIRSEIDSFVGCATNLTYVVNEDLTDGVKLFLPKSGWPREIHTNEYASRKSGSVVSLEGDFLFLDDGNMVALLYYFGTEEIVRIPETDCGSPVVRIVKGAFPQSGKTRKVVLPRQFIQFPDSNEGAQKSLPEFVKDPRMPHAADFGIIREEN